MTAPHAPGPRGRWLLGNLRELQREPLALYSRSCREFGHHSRIRILGSVHLHLLTHPDAVEHVLVRHAKNYRKPDMFNRPMQALVGEGVISSEGELWLRQRRIMQPAFAKKSLAAVAAVMREEVTAFIDAQRREADGRTVDAAALMNILTFRVADRTLLGHDGSAGADEMGRAFAEGFAAVSRRMNSLPLVPTWFPTPGNLRFNRAKRTLDAYIDRTIADRRKSPSPRPDLLSLLLASRDDETGTGLTDAQVRDQALTLLVAGHDTVGAALSWAIFLLAKSPKVQEDVADAARGGQTAVDDAPPLVRAAFEEAMRLYPPAWGQPREPIADDVVGGYPIPAKAPITICQYVTHRHPDFWDDPEAFRPERFMGDAAKSRHRFAYFPFGGGPRVCIGTAFAMIEGPMILGELLKAFRIEAVPGVEPGLDTTFTLEPRGGVQVVLRRR